ncbi:Bacterial regulatory proteins, luxR family [Serratia quinivorans]|nr:Bacterial regulatory proteins, luxR family [Serratia quinivorans]CAI1633701.1 Bacterial regulatory proteins, luxR family [Serratia quinivorans]
MNEKLNSDNELKNTLHDSNHRIRCRLSIISNCKLTCYGLSDLLVPHVEHFRSYSSPIEFMKNIEEEHDFILFHASTKNLPFLHNLSLLYRRVYRAQNCYPALLIDPRTMHSRSLAIKMDSPATFSILQPTSVLLNELFSWMIQKKEQPTKKNMPLTILTEKERQVVLATLKGMPIATLARQRGVNVKTIYTQRRTAMDKLGIKNTHELLCLRVQGLL